MKIKYIFLVIFLSLYFSYCSKSDESPTPTPCVAYCVILYDDCPDGGFKDWIKVEKSEYDRLLNILNESTEACVYVNTINWPQGNSFEGYLTDVYTCGCFDPQF